MLSPFRRPSLTAVFVALLAVLAHRPLSAAETARTNLVVIMTDNQGAWTLGCYGNPDVRSPHIDRLAEEGLLFERAYASNAVCSPTRATFLTGLLPSQHGVHCFLRGGRLQVGPEARNTLAEFTSLPEVLKTSGYRCGLVGKWHLGDNLHAQEGFDDYWITMPHGGTSTFYDAQIIEDGQLRREPEYLTDFWTRHALQFLEQRAAEGEPFFLFLPYNGPYGLSRLLLREGRNRHAEYYADRMLPSFPREPMHPWLFSNTDFLNNPVSIRRMATEISGIDDGVGRVLAALKTHGLEQNTLVVFLADQGWVGGHGGFWGMGDHTRPLTARDGMMHIPLIFRHPGCIPAGRRTDMMVANYDLMPTLLSYLGLKDRQPAAPESPGRDFASVLRGEQLESWRNEVYYDFESVRAVRTENWKLVKRAPHGPDELYHLSEDPDEDFNRISAPEAQQQRVALERRLTDFFDRYASPKYDLWQEGESQTVRFDPFDASQLAENSPQAADADAATVGARPKEAETRISDVDWLSVPEGFTVERAAGPPLVKHPMMAGFDDRGRLYVAESAGENMRRAQLEDELPNMIRRLEDTDQDGIFDRATTFADRLTLPMGACWYQDALYVAAPPNIWRFRDLDDDGVAEERTQLVSDFGYTGNAASVHGCFVGPDGRLYWCDGRHGHDIPADETQVASKGDGAYIFSCLPDGSDVRVHCGGGMDNPVEVDFTDEGEMIGSVNILYSRPRVDCLVHWLYGGAYPHSERVLGEFVRTGELLGPIHRFGHVAVSGMTRYRSGVLDRSFRNDIFVTIFNTGKVVRCELQRQGASFRVQEREFLVSRHSDFHPTDVLEDADGSLLVVDTGGWFLNGCPTSQLAKPEVRGGIYRVRRRGSTEFADPWGRDIDWTAQTPTQLMNLLNDTRFRVRERAVEECARRGAVAAAPEAPQASATNSGKAIPPLVVALQRMAVRGDTRVRMNALWALARTAPEAIPTPSLDEDVRVLLVTTAALASSGHRPPELDVAGLLQHPHPAVRRNTARLLGRTGTAADVPLLLEALERPMDRTEEHAILYALIEVGNVDVLREGFEEAEQPAVRRGALIALGQLSTEFPKPEQLAECLDSNSQRLREAVLILELPMDEAAGPLLSLLKRWMQTDAAWAARRDVGSPLLDRYIAHPGLARVLARRLAQHAATPEVTRAILQALANGNRIIPPPQWLPALKQLLAEADAGLVEATISAVAALETPAFTEALQGIATDDSRPPLQRVLALEALAGTSSRVTPEAFEILLELVRDSASPTERVRAAQLIGRATLTEDQLQQLAPVMPTAGPLVLRELLKPFQRSRQLEPARRMLEALGQSNAFLSLPTNEFSDVIKRYPPELLALANPLLDRLKSRDQQKLDRLERLVPAVDEGDPAVGRTLFTSEKAKCSVCHRVGEDGGRIGPELSEIGRIRSARDLLEAIVFPSASIVRDYEPFTIVMDSGQVYNGLVVRETADSVFLQQQTGDPIALPRDAIEIIQASAVSIMPQGLDQGLTERELADLVAYLRSLGR